MKKLKLIKNIIIASIFFLNFSFSYASSGSIIIQPENPGPYENVNLLFKSYSFDPDNASYIWDVNGKVILSGKGEKALDLKTENIGSQLKVTLRVTTADGEEFVSGINITPQAVDLVWESTESYTPPFYEGKALPGENSEVKVTALPMFYSNGKVIDGKDISYAWYINDKFQQKFSGRGKQSIRTRLDYLYNENVIKVIARSDSGDNAEKRVTIYPTSINPVFYLRDTIYGTKLNNSIDQRFEVTKEFTIEMVPYFLSSKNGLNEDITYNWSLDGIPINPDSNTILTFKPKDNSSGSKTLSLSIDNTKRILQKVTSGLEIIFDTR